MRTIKFRGRDAVHPDHPWRYGDLVHNMRITETGTAPRTMVGGYEVDPETVGQFTGVQDLQGRDIYEGDILKYGSTPATEVYVKVVFVDGQFTADSKFIRFCYLLTLSHGTLVGDVFENPELLEIKPLV